MTTALYKLLNEAAAASAVCGKILIYRVDDTPGVFQIYRDREFNVTMCKWYPTAKRSDDLSKFSDYRVMPGHYSALSPSLVELGMTPFDRLWCIDKESLEDSGGGK